MKPLLIAVLVLTPALAFAGPNDQDQSSARQARIEKRLQTFRTIGLAEALNLDAGQAMQLNQAMQQYDERRKPLHEQLRQSKQILERAADGDPSAANQVDQAIDSAFQAHQQIMQLDREMLTDISKGMSPQEKAKLTLFLAHFKRQMMEHFAHHRRQHRRWQGRRGPNLPAPSLTH